MNKSSFILEYGTWIFLNLNDSRIHGDRFCASVTWRDFNRVDLGVWVQEELGVIWFPVSGRIASYSSSLIFLTWKRIWSQPLVANQRKMADQKSIGQPSSRGFLICYFGKIGRYIFYCAAVKSMKICERDWTSGSTRSGWSGGAPSSSLRIRRRKREKKKSYFLFEGWALFLFFPFSDSWGRRSRRRSPSSIDPHTVE